MFIGREEIEDTLVKVGKITGVDIVKIANQIDNGEFSFCGSVRDMYVHDSFRDALKYYKESEYDAAYVEIMHGIRLFFKYYNHVPDTSEDADIMADQYKMFAGILRNDLVYKRGLKESITNEIKDMSGGLPMLTYYIDPRDIVNIKKQIGVGKYLRLYEYRRGKKEKKKNIEVGKFALKDTIVATNSILDLIGVPVTDDMWHIHIGLMLEKYINLSYFMIVMTYNDGVWILCDKPNYENIDQIDKVASRGGGMRFSEDREKHLDFLPYILIEKVKEEREKTTTITKKGGQEIHTFDMKSYLYPTWLYLIREAIEQIIGMENGGNNIIKLMETQQLALGMGEDVVDEKEKEDEEKSFYKCNNEELDKLFNELHPTETLPAVSSTEIAKTLTDAAILMGEDEFKKNVIYIKHKKIADASIQEQVDLMEEVAEIGGRWVKNPQEEWKNLINLAFRNETAVESMERILFSGNEVSFIDLDTKIYSGRIHYGDGGGSVERMKYGFVGNSKEYPWSYDIFMRGWTEKIGFKCGPKVTCQYNCGTEIHSGSQWKRISFRRYTEMMALFGCDRKDLPVYYRNYLSHICIPYTGNSILDNVKPEYLALEKDPCSRNNPNDINIYIPYCGKCKNKLYKKYKIADNSLVVYSSKKNKILDIIDINNFKIEDYES